MISGIRSLVATHEQIILAWTGDIESTSASGSTLRRAVPTSSLSEEDKKDIESEVKNYQSILDDGTQGRKKMSYVPVFLDDKIAHGHYEGYCKTSTFLYVLIRH